MLFVLSKITLTECQPRSTNLGIGFKELITNVEITEKGDSHQTFAQMSVIHKLSQNRKKI